MRRLLLSSRLRFLLSSLREPFPPLPPAVAPGRGLACLRRAGSPDAPRRCRRLADRKRIAVALGGRAGRRMCLGGVYWMCGTGHAWGSSFISARCWRLQCSQASPAPLAAPGLDGWDGFRSRVGLFQGPRCECVVLCSRAVVGGSLDGGGLRGVAVCLSGLCGGRRRCGGWVNLCKWRPCRTSPGLGWARLGFGGGGGRGVSGARVRLNMRGTGNLRFDQNNVAKTLSRGLKGCR